MVNKPKQRQRSTAPARKPTRSQPAAAQPAARGNLNRIGALWLSRNKTSQGDRYMTGRITLEEGGDEIRLMVFKNGYKQEERHPDYIIYEPEAKPDTAAREAQAKGKGRATHASDDDIPF